MNLLEQNIILQSVSPLDTSVVALIDKLNVYQEGLYNTQRCSLETPELLQKNHAYMLGAYQNEVLVGIGAIKLLEGYAEVKRMYVAEDYRGLSIAENILKKVEAYAVQNGITRICLETGNLHTAALAFYRKSGYHEIVAFGNYQPNEVSIYFEKICNNA